MGLRDVVGVHKCKVMLRKNNAEMADLTQEQDLRVNCGILNSFFLRKNYSAQFTDVIFTFLRQFGKNLKIFVLDIEKFTFII